ncbi:uncharacterized protein G2W53_015047 [Senna tora]|uniref:Uncharacterized protein n=1 Tax=Senna tora TaxID=362788 RepID=A0A834WUV6_9FABA|nr:uncharacterized protein G2W53_015047 [Senna tora]
MPSPLAFAGILVSILQGIWFHSRLAPSSTRHHRRLPPRFTTVSWGKEALNYFQEDKSLFDLVKVISIKCFGKTQGNKDSRDLVIRSLLVASLSLAQPLQHSHRRQKLSTSKEDPWPPDRCLSVVVSLHQISQRRRLVAANLAGENAKVLRESEGEEASATAEEEVFGSERQKLPPLKEDPWPPDRSLDTVVSFHQISRRRRLVAADLAGENAEVLWESEGEEASTAAKEEVFGLEEDPWPPDRSLGTVVSFHQISRRRRLVAADLVGENVEVLWESEGEEASTAAKEEVFGLEAAKTLTIEGGSMATGQISRRRRLVASDLLVPSSCCSRSCRRKRKNASGE